LAARLTALPQTVLLDLGDGKRGRRREGQGTEGWEMEEGKGRTEKWRNRRGGKELRKERKVLPQ